MSPRDLASPEPAPAETPARPRPPLWLLIAMTGIGPFTMQVPIPTLPLMARDLGVSYAAAQLTLTLYLVGVALGQLLHGPLSDRYGRRRVLRGALVLFLVASALATLAPGLGSLVAARVAQAVGACAGMVLARAIVRDVWPREEAASRIGYVTMGMTIAPMLAPLLGALIEEQVGWRGTMAACLLLGLPLLWAVRTRLPETLAAPQPLPGPAGLARAWGEVLALPAFRRIAAVGAASTGLFFAFMAGAPKVSVEMGYAPRAYALTFVAVSVAFALGSGLAGRLSGRLGVVRMLRLGLWVVMAGAAASVATQLLAPPALWSFFLPMAVIAVGNGMSLPNAVAAAVSVRPERAGTASGLLGALQMAFGALMTVVTGALEAGDGVATALVMAACGAASLLAFRAARRGL